jgi:hypothetical protein
MGFSNGQGGQLLRKSRGILTVLRISLLGSSPQGRRENIAELRIQTAAEGVNDSVRAIRYLISAYRNQRYVTLPCPGDRLRLISYVIEGGSGRARSISHRRLWRCRRRHHQKSRHPDAATRRAATQARQPRTAARSPAKVDRRANQSGWLSLILPNGREGLSRLGAALICLLGIFKANRTELFYPISQISHLFFSPMEDN